MDVKLAEAAAKWSESSPDGKFVYEFIRAESRESANFVVNLVTDFYRGPYLVEWSTGWGATTVAHEVGHMMGLDDEYNQFTNSLGIGSDWYETSMRQKFADAAQDRFKHTIIIKRFVADFVTTYGSRAGDARAKIWSG